MPKRLSHPFSYRPVVWVTGASRGIGSEIAGQFAMIGCRVCLTGRNKKELLRVQNRIVRLGGQAFVFPCDITNQPAILRTANNIRRSVGEVDILINNAGITVFKSFLKTSLKEFSDIISTNLMGQITAIHAVLPTMVQRRNGWVINVLSTASRLTFEGSAAYTAAKAGMYGFSKVLREELRLSNVKVVDILPGPTATDMWSAASRRKHSSKMMKAKSVAEAVLALYQFPPDVIPEEIVMRPILGNLS